MKRLILTLGFIGLFLSTYAQSYKGKGDHKLDFGYDIYGYGNGLRAKYDYGLNDLFSIGLGGSYYFNNEDYDYFIYGRTSFHLGILMDLPSSLDVYPGVDFGYLSSSEVGFTAYLGVRYCLTKNVGLYAELGNNGSVGLSINV